MAELDTSQRQVGDVEFGPVARERLERRGLAVGSSLEGVGARASQNCRKERDCHAKKRLVA